MVDAMFINNKYKKWHDSIIAKAKHRILEGYKEVHHIIPKSCGGTNDKDNLVPLTAREHYIVHMLLPFCVIKKYRFKMIKGFMYMNVKPKTTQRFYKINSKMYEKFRIEFGLTLKGVKLSEETKAKMRGRKLSKETKAKIKEVKEEVERRVERVREEVKDVVEQSKDVIAAAKGKSRRGRKPKK